MKPKFDLKQAGCVCGQGVVSNWDAMCGYCRGEVNANHLRTIWQSEDEAEYEAEYEKYLAVSESRATHRRKRELYWHEQKIAAQERAQAKVEARRELMEKRRGH